MEAKTVSMRRATWKNLGWLLIIALASLPLIVCSGNKPTQVTKQPKPAAAAPGGDAAAGQALFVKNCTICHYADKTDKKIGPGLKGLLKNKELPANHKPVTEASVRAQIESGDPAKGMPAFGTKFSKAEIDGLIAYLKTL